MSFLVSRFSPFKLSSISDVVNIDTGHHHQGDGLPVVLGLRIR